MKIPLQAELIQKITHRIFDNLDCELQDYQMDVIFDDAQRIIINKARGIGISFAIAFKVLLLALTVRGEYIIVCQDKPNSEHILKYIIEFFKLLETAPLDFPKLKNAGSDMVAFSNGSSIYSKPSEPKAIRGLHGLVYWDEVAFHPNSEEMKKAISGCLRPNYPLIMSSTPAEMSGAFYDTWTKAKIVSEGGRWAKYSLPYDVCKIPQYITGVEEEKQEAIEQGFYDDWLQEYMCKFIDGASRLFSYDLITSSIFLDKAPCNMAWGGMDFGKKVDESVFFGVGKSETGLIYTTNIIPYNLGTDYCVQLDSIVRFIKSEREVHGFNIDATGVGVKLLEDLKGSDIGYMVNGITFTNAIKEKMAMFLYTGMQSGKIKIPNDKKLFKQIHGIKRTKTDTGLSRYKHEEGKHDDFFWALCLALYGYIDNMGEDQKTEIKGVGQTRISQFKERNLWNS